MCEKRERRAGTGGVDASGRRSLSCIFKHDFAARHDKKTKDERYIHAVYRMEVHRETYSFRETYGYTGKETAALGEREKTPKCYRSKPSRPCALNGMPITVRAKRMRFQFSIRCIGCSVRSI